MDRSSLEAVPAAQQPAVEELRSLVEELLAALGNALHDERDSAERSLRRAAAILQRADTPQAETRQDLKGRLAPWQIRTVTAHIEGSLDQPLRSGDLAKLVRLSPGHFSRKFRNSFGCSPIEYVTFRRIERAQGLMLSTDLALGQIAIDCGVTDQAHFSRLFHRVVGESPRVWRRARASRPF